MLEVQDLKSDAVMTLLFIRNRGKRQRLNSGMDGWYADCSLPHMKYTR